MRWCVIKKNITQNKMPKAKLCPDHPIMLATLLYASARTQAKSRHLGWKWTFNNKLSVNYQMTLHIFLMWWVGGIVGTKINNIFSYMGQAMRKHAFLHIRTAKAHISASAILAVLSGGIHWKCFCNTLLRISTYNICCREEWLRCF